MGKKLIILLPTVEKIYNLQMINATVILPDNITEQESEVRFHYEQFVFYRCNKTMPKETKTKQKRRCDSQDSFLLGKLGDGS